MKNCLERCLNLLANYNIKVTRVVSDSAGYVREMLDMLHERNMDFEVHIPFNPYFKGMMDSLKKADWDKTELETANEFRLCEVTEFAYIMHGSSYTSRIVAAREPSTQNSKFYTDEDRARMEKVAAHIEKLRKEKPEALKGNAKPYKPTEWKKYKGYKYKLIITSDNKYSPVEVITAYNKRGTAEQQFAAMKNDFGWRLPPFVKMEENTVFMIAAALANNVFRGLVKRYSKILKELRPETRLRDFIYVFVAIACEYVGNDTYIIHEPEVDYKKLIL